MRSNVRKFLTAFAVFALLSAGTPATQYAIAETECISWGVDDEGEFVCTEWANTGPDPDSSDLEAPTGLTVETRTTSSIRLSWDAYDGAVGWVLGISTDNAETWKELVLQNENSYQGMNLTDLKTASAMWIRVAALAPDKSPYSDSMFVTTKGAKPSRVTVVDWKGKPVKGGKITWRMVDNSAWSSRTYGLTDAGVNDFPSAPAGAVDVTLKDALTADGALVSGSWRTTLGFDKTVLRLPETDISAHTVRVVLPNGLPVIGATVTIPEPVPVYGEYGCIKSKTIQVWMNTSYIDEWGDYIEDGEYVDEEVCEKYGRPIIDYSEGTNIESTQVVNGFSFVSQVGPYSGKTDINGNFVIYGFFPDDTEATVTYDDSIITQQQTVVLSKASTRVELDYMPWVAVDTPVVTGNPSQLIPIDVSINDAEIGGAIFGRASVKPSVKITIVPPKGASTGKCKPTLTGNTNSKGKLKLKVCATKSGIYTIKSAGAAATKSIRVQVKNAAPMPVTSVTAKSTSIGRATVTWNKPLFDGKLAIKTYTVVAKATGKKTITKIVKSNLKTLTLTGLSNATNYTISITANNSKGSSVPVVVKVPVA
jgi:hypothetical protein